MASVVNLVWWKGSVNPGGRDQWNGWLVRSDASATGVVASYWQECNDQAVSFSTGEQGSQLIHQFFFLGNGFQHRTYQDLIQVAHEQESFHRILYEVQPFKFGLWFPRVCNNQKWVKVTEDPDFIEVLELIGIPDLFDAKSILELESEHIF
ncbi:hypothetical protein TNCV_4252681 [Trichonephila clavipes]|nr:hypothetical protein TNCV_4252681 [Trichonephila clavipes]